MTGCELLSAGGRLGPVAHDETPPGDETVCRDDLPDEAIERPVVEGIAAGATKDITAAVLVFQYDPNAITFRARRDTLARDLSGDRDRVLRHLSG